MQKYEKIDCLNWSNFWLTYVAKLLPLIASNISQAILLRKLIMIDSSSQQIPSNIFSWIPLRITLELFWRDTLYVYFYSKLVPDLFLNVFFMCFLDPRISLDFFPGSSYFYQGSFHRSFGRNSLRDSPLNKSKNFFQG